MRAVGGGRRARHWPGPRPASAGDRSPQAIDPEVRNTWATLKRRAIDASLQVLDRCLLGARPSTVRAHYTTKSTLWPTRVLRPPAAGRPTCR